MTAAQKQEAAEARATLLKVLKPGDTVYTVLNHVSRSGMQREISLYAIGEDRRPFWLTGLAAKVLDMRRGSRDGLKTSGCGMDMGYHLVSNLSYALFPKGFGCTGKDCPSNAHSNGDRDYTPHCVMVAEHGAHWHSEAGYALKQAWL